MKGYDVPDLPWQKVGMDIMELDKEQYIVITDYHSKYFELSQLTSTTTVTTIKYLKPHLARHEIPEEVISNNDPQFSSKEFQEFSRTIAYGNHRKESFPCPFD